MEVMAGNLGFRAPTTKVENGYLAPTLLSGTKGYLKVG